MGKNASKPTRSFSLISTQEPSASRWQSEPCLNDKYRAFIVYAEPDRRNGTRSSKRKSKEMSRIFPKSSKRNSKESSVITKPSSVSLTGELETKQPAHVSEARARWTRLLAEYRARPELYSRLDEETAAMIKLLTVLAVVQYREAGDEAPWEAVSTLLHERLRSSNEHERKIQLVEGITKYLSKDVNLPHLALPLYDSLHSNLVVLLGNSDQRTLMALRNKGHALSEIGRLEEGWEILLTVYAAETELSMRSQVTLYFLFLTAELLNNSGSSQGLQLCTQILKQCTLDFTDDLGTMIYALRYLAEIHQRSGGHVVALGFVRRMTEFATESLGDTHPRTLLCRLMRAEVLLKGQQQLEAWQEFVQVGQLAGRDSTLEVCDLDQLQSLIFSQISQLRLMDRPVEPSS